MFGPSKRSLYRTLERERESFAAERRLLIDQILHLTGRTWTPPPSPVPVVTELDHEAEALLATYTASPEQQPL